MLYVTTRNKDDAYTVQHTLTSDSAPDGGRFVPLTLPAFEEKEILKLKEYTFGAVVAKVLNAFFSSGFNGWDVDFAIGRNASQLKLMNHRIAVAELWHNINENFQYVVDSLFNRICDGRNIANGPTEWAVIAIRISVLFGVYSELLRNCEEMSDRTIDICLPASDFSGILSAYYSRKMGLPIKNIICTSKSNSSVWDLMQRGTFLPAQADDIRIAGIERLIHSALDGESFESFVNCMEQKKAYSIDEEMLPVFNEGLFCSVVDDNRGDSVINSVFRSNEYILDPVTALCYAGLQDHRAKYGVGRLTLLLSEESPKAQGSKY